MAGILIFYEPLPGDLRTAIESDAHDQNVSPYDVVRGILCDRYGLAYGALTTSYRPAGDRFKLRVAPHLRRRLSLDAAENGGTIRGIVLSVLASHYGLAPIETGRRPRSAA